MMNAAWGFLGLFIWLETALATRMVCISVVNRLGLSTGPRWRLLRASWAVALLWPVSALLFVIFPLDEWRRGAERVAGCRIEARP